MLILLLTSAALGIYYKKRQTQLKRKPYVTLIGPIDVTDETLRQTVELSSLFVPEFRVNILSKQVNEQGVPDSVLSILKKNDTRLGKFIIFEDRLGNLEEAPLYLRGVTQNKQIRIAYSTSESTLISHERALLLNLYFDAIVVPDAFLVDSYVHSGVNIPIFVLPLGFDLQNFLDKPLKTERNPIFLFGNLGASTDLENQITLIRAFAKTFGSTKDVALHIHSKAGDANVRQEIIDEITKQNGSNIFFTEANLQKDAYIKFFQSLDCYVSLSKGENFSLRPRQAMALGIPTIVSNNTAKKTLCKSNLVQPIRSEVLEIVRSLNNNPLFQTVQFNCEEDDVAKSLQEVYQNYTKHLKNSYQARIWSASSDYSSRNLQNLYKNLISPRRILLGQKNEITSDYLMTNSKELYEKYQALATFRPFPSQPYPDSMPTAVINSLRSIELTTSQSGLSGIDCIYVINLDERPKRWEYAKKCFDEQKLTPNRVSAINGWTLSLEERLRLTDGQAKPLDGGALGCLLTHVSIYKDAVKRGFETVWICEDDIAFKEKAEKIPDLVKKLTALDPDWDILYTDYATKGIGMQHTRPKQPPYKALNESVSDEFVRMHGRYNTHSMIFSKKGLAKVYDYFTHMHLWSPIDNDIHYVPDLKEYSVKKDVVTTINDSSVLATDGSSDTQSVSSLNSRYR